MSSDVPACEEVACHSCAAAAARRLAAGPVHRREYRSKFFQLTVSQAFRLVSLQKTVHVLLVDRTSSIALQQPAKLQPANCGLHYWLFDNFEGHQCKNAQ